MSEGFITQHDFAKYLNEFAAAQVMLPKGLDEIVFAIQLPMPNLYCYVIPGFGLRTDKIQNPEGKVRIANKVTGDVPYSTEVRCTVDNWEDEYRDVIEDTCSNWRLHVL